MFLVTLVCLLLMITVFTVNGYRKVQYGRHLEPQANTSFGPGAWITLALVPLTIISSLMSGFAVCCPGRFKRKPREEHETVVPHEKQEVHEEHQEHREHHEERHHEERHQKEEV